MIVEISDIRDSIPYVLWQGDITHLPRVGEWVYLPVEPRRPRQVDNITHLVSKNEIVIIVR